MKHYKVVLEIEVDAESPLKAAKKLETWGKQSLMSFTYVVQDDQTDEIFTVDLDELDEDAVLPDPTHQPMIGTTVVSTKEDTVTCEGCGEVIPESSLYCPNCGDENF